MTKGGMLLLTSASFLTITATAAGAQTAMPGPSTAAAHATMVQSNDAVDSQTQAATPTTGSVAPPAPPSSEAANHTIDSQTQLATPTTGTVTPQASPSSEPANDSGDIVVTAQRRSESLQRVPIAISAFSSATLEEANVVTVFDLPKLAPSLHLDTGLSSAKARITIRGIGSAGGSAIEPSVATFINGIYIPREGATVGAYYDLAAIEVLRGPQGTLFGRNASVGAINIRTALPTYDFGGAFSVEAGTGEHHRAEGHINVPVSDRARLRFAGVYDSLDGYWYNELDGNRLGGLDTFSGRLTGQFDLTPNVVWTARGSYSKRDGDGFANYALLGDRLPAPQLQTFINRYAALGQTIDLNAFDRHVNLYSGDDLHEKQYDFSSDLNWEVGGGFSVRLLDSYAHWQSNQVGTPVLSAQVPSFTQLLYWDSTSNSHELQLISPTDLLNDRLSFVAGLYYMHERFETTEAYQFATFACNLIYANLGATLYNACLASTDSHAFDEAFEQTTNSYAAYGQATIKLNPTLDLVLGARWTHDDKSGNVVTVVNNPSGSIVAANENTELDLSESRPTWRINLSWHPRDTLLFYGSYSTGFKSGGFNSQTSNPALGQRRVFRPETVKNYEVGVKSQWFDRKLTLNVAAYQMEIEGYQDRSYNGIGYSVQNAGDIRNRGIEIDSSVRPIDGLQLNLSAAYLDSVFTHYPAAANLPGLTGTQDLAGERPTFTPPWTIHGGLDYERPIGRDLTLGLRSDVNYVSRQQIGYQNDANPLTYQEEVALVSGRLSLYGPDRRWSVYAFGDNLTNEGYCTSIAYQSFAGLFGTVAPGISPLRCNTVGRPRTIGVGGGFNF